LLKLTQFYLLKIKIALLLILCSFHIYGQNDLKLPDTVSVITYRIKGKTATGYHTYKVKEPFVAISRDLLAKYPYHSYIELKDCRWAGKYKVLDIMNSRHQKTVDVFSKKKVKHNKVSCRCISALKN
jgi:3D (Asp-Asp-Asp) domain-containing protein